MTPKELAAELRKIDSSSTPGPWDYDSVSGEPSNYLCGSGPGDDDVCPDICMTEDRHFHDVSLLLSLRNNLPTILAALEVDEPWVSVEERLPEAEGRFLIDNSGGQVFIDNFDGNKFRLHANHWKPLPKPPEGE